MLIEIVSDLNTMNVNITNANVVVIEITLRTFISVFLFLDMFSFPLNIKGM